MGNLRLMQKLTMTRLSIPAWPLALGLISAHVYVGLGYLLGPDYYHSSGSFYYLERAMSIEAWGALIFAGGFSPIPVLLHAESRALLLGATAHVLSGLVLVAFALGFLAAVLGGTTQGFGGTAFVGFMALVHFCIAHSVYLKCKEREKC